MNAVIAVLLGVVLVVLVVVLVRQNKAPAAPSVPALTAEDIAGVVQTNLSNALEALTDRARQDRDESLKLASDRVAETGAVAFDKNAQAIKATLDHYRQGLESQIAELKTELTSLRETNAKNYGNVDNAVGSLIREAQALNKVLSSAQGRGNWGERMLEDILSQSGFERGINYERQETLADGGRPDYSFFLPPDRVLYLDSKFPLDNYIKYFEATDEQSRLGYRDLFIKNVEQRVKELEKRDYANQSNRVAIDYVLLFIPNESILGFIQQEKPSLIDEATRRRVMLCSPLTLYAFLGVVRQATESFKMEQSANVVLGLLNNFGKAWKGYSKEVIAIGGAFNRVAKNFEKLAPSSRVYKSLEKQILLVEDVVREKQIAVSEESLVDFNDALRSLHAGDESEDDE